MICKKCGKTIADASKFCGYCGESVERDVEVNNKSELNQVEEPIKQTNNSNQKKNSNKKTILILISILVIVVGIVCVVLFMNKDKDKEVTGGNVASEPKESEYRINGNSLEKFDLYFLQLENEKVNKIYSPLSIKYALAMLNEGTDGESKEEISAVIGDYKAKKYVNSENMSFANAIFINELYKSSVKKEYTDILLNKYNAEVIFDTFESTNNINSWISEKTLNLINGALEGINKDTRFMLVNALGIDMEWEEKFIRIPGGVMAAYRHEKFSWSGPENVTPNKFNEQEVSGMGIVASLNNYDIVKELGEDKIRETVGSELRKYLEDPNCPDADYYLNGDYSEENMNNAINKYLDEYIEEINSNYKRVDRTTDFSLYVDDNVKAFAKDLKEYNGTTLQYIGIMPTEEELDEFVNNISVEKVNTILNNLKELKLENFNDGVVTVISGFIPKFKFDYQLSLKNDLQKLGITSVFDSAKSNLTKITSEENMFIEDASHKANIEFTQDGIKAAAVTTFGGRGAGATFDYLYDIPVEEIDLTFDKPYMFLIRDKKSGEVWFTGTVYNPLSWEEEPENSSFGGGSHINMNWE